MAAGDGSAPRVGLDPSAPEPREREVVVTVRLLPLPPSLSRVPSPLSPWYLPDPRLNALPRSSPADASASLFTSLLAFHALLVIYPPAFREPPPQAQPSLRPGLGCRS